MLTLPTMPTNGGDSGILLAEQPKANSFSGEQNGYEVCVLCGKTTSVSSEKPISVRQFYIEGAGQLCEDCYCATYQTDKRTTATR